MQASFLLTASPLSLLRKPTLSLRTPPLQSKFTHFAQSQLHFHPFRLSLKRLKMSRERRVFRAVCYSAPLTPRNLQWICTVSTAVLMLSGGTAVQKSFLVPLFALQAPASIISWIKSEYGIWTAFLALLVRLFFFIPGELELPFIALLLVIVAPYEAVSLRGTQGGHIVSLVIAGYLTFQHFSRTGSLQKAFDRGSIVASLAIICITIVLFLRLI